MDLREWRRFDDAVEAGYEAATRMIKAMEPEDLVRFQAGVA